MKDNRRKRSDLKRAFKEASAAKRVVLLAKLTRIAITPRSHLLRAKFTNGAKVAGFNRDGYGGRGIYLFGEAVEPELASLHQFLRPGFVFVDVGANVGVYTMQAAKEVGPDGLVLAVEPFLGTAFRLLENARENGYENVRVRVLCLAEATRHSSLYLVDSKPNSFSLRFSVGEKSLSVLSVSLDDLCTWEGLERLDYLKIDTETTETAVIAGGIRTISKFRPIIQVEGTKSGSSLPADYRRFAAHGSANEVFVPSENKTAVESAIGMGWTETR